ncbi:MAG: hypothetical protein CMI63_17965 [Parvularcula sp.]|nr:hypothetical protein [Parvularcula sp.]
MKNTNYDYALRIYENKHLGKFVGPSKKNVDFFNGSIEIHRIGKFVFDLRDFELARLGKDPDERKALSALGKDVAEQVLECNSAYDKGVLLARLFRWDGQKRKKTSAMGVIVLNIEDRRYGVILAEDESEPLLLTGVVYPCPQQKDSSKNIPAYFYSSYDVSDVA